MVHMRACACLIVVQIFNLAFFFSHIFHFHFHVLNDNIYVPIYIFHYAGWR